MYFFVLLGMQETLPFTFETACIIRWETVESDRHDRGLGIQPQLKVAGAVGWAPVLPCDVALITVGVPGQILQANMTGLAVLWACQWSFAWLWG